MEVIIKDIKNGGTIPERYSCDGDDISPEITITDENNTGYYIVIMNDPDAPSGLFTHWILYNIKSGNVKINEKQKHSKIIDAGLQGINDFGKIGYGGPCPPSGTHRYFFKLYRIEHTIDEDKINAEKIYKITKNLKEEFSLYAKYTRK